MAAKRRTPPSSAPADQEAPQDGSARPRGAGATGTPAKKPAAASARRTAPARKAAGDGSAPARRRGGVKRAADLHAAAALIVAHNQARRIAATVRAARSIPGIDLVLVVDDASGDNTQELARKAGAVVVRHSHHRGRTASIETGSSVIAMRDEPGRTPRAVLLLPGGLGHHAVGAAPLVPAVVEHVADLAIAVTEGQARTLSTSGKAARRAIEQASGWTPTDPLGPIRCLTREALEAAMPLARGAGLEVGMTIDVLHAGMRATEVECEIRHRAPGTSPRAAAARAAQYRDVMMAVSTRRVKSGISGAREAVARRTRQGREGDALDADATVAKQTATEEDQ
ncbi:glycosyltransferase family 2 protein [Demequina activiva]|uniref:Glucosyl-3-phosphoglycerate synthase n=1 Tax=Demequina activiva TaxID=1582364 RepID=A0A919Q2G1_9MICO|nr:glycosyltransferase [Demequina activiva]GIG54032.1 hypothetical protein Dac01nite_07840 [Demequina activiva]